MRGFILRPWFFVVLILSGVVALRFRPIEDLAYKHMWLTSSCRLAFPLSIIQATQDYGELGCNRSISREPIRLGGRIYPFGISTHAKARIQFEPVPITFRPGVFKGIVGLSDHVLFVGGSTEVAVHVNGVERWRSRRLVAGVVDTFQVAVGPGNSIELVVDDAGDGIYSDEVAWVGLQIQ
jgi:alpha-galactosidase